MREESRLRRLAYKLCPHWYWPIADVLPNVMMEVTRRERCRFCGHERVHAKVPEPHSSRDREKVREDLQQPGYEVVVEEWLPYGSKGP